MISNAGAGVNAKFGVRPNSADPEFADREFPLATHDPTTGRRAWTGTREPQGGSGIRRRERHRTNVGRQQPRNRGDLQLIRDVACPAEQLTVWTGPVWTGPQLSQGSVLRRRGNR